MKYLDIKPEVKEALEQGKAVVALESTIIAHGMPYPKNVETALAVEDVIRKNGAVPATIAIIDGVIKVGLTPEEIEYLGTAKGVLKVSRRDFPVVMAKKMDGATTVAGTMMAAAMAGIKVFVTGGIGGVHRGAGETHDISADLEELKQTNVTVVCAGVKSILDIAGTLEYLETKGVPVVTCGGDYFPAFYSRSSGIPAELREDDPKVIADMIKAKDELGLGGGMLVACPVPEDDEIPFEKMDGATTVAGTMMAAAMAGIKVFVTGGIGGVHRGAGETHDISADLEELKQTNVTVVCAGVKSILDIAGTLEYLETKGVPVVTCGGDYFPAFYSRSSGIPAELREDDPKVIADMIRAKDELGLSGGMLVACPVPEDDEIPFEKMDGVIKEALRECEEQGIKGKRITPFLLSKVKDLTEGASLEANIKLVLHNAEIGAKIACGLE